MKDALHCGERLGEVERLVASGRDLGDVKKARGWYKGREYPALEIAKEKKRAELFAVTVFFCDLLQLKSDFLATSHRGAAPAYSPGWWS